jgi:hypothetical protein
VVQVASKAAKRLIRKSSVRLVGTDCQEYGTVKVLTRKSFGTEFQDIVIHEFQQDQ